MGPPIAPLRKLWEGAIAPLRKLSRHSFLKEAMGTSLGLGFEALVQKGFP